MTAKKLLIPVSLLILISLHLYCSHTEIISVEVLKWKNGAQAAYTIIHDDLCNPEISGIYRYADTIAYNRGIRFGAAAIAKLCYDKGEPMWDIMKRMVDHGHEIVSHSWAHGASVDLGWLAQNWSVELDVIKSKEVIEKYVPGAEVTFMVFPYDAYDEQRIEEIRAHGYLGARAGIKKYTDDRGVNVNFENFDPFRNCYFDAYVSRAEQQVIDASESPYTVSIYNNENDDIEIQHLDSALASGGWSIQELHTVDDEEPWGWGRMSVERYRALLDYAKSKVESGVLWVGTPTEVIRYIVTRERIGKPTIEGNVMSFLIPEDFDARYACEVTVKINTSGKVSQIIGDQSGLEIETTRVERNSFLMNVNPVNGDVVLYFEDQE